MQYIERKSLLYGTKVEYSNFTINHIEGCSHGCLYPCYAMMMAKRFGKVQNYEDWIDPKIVKNTEIYTHISPLGIGRIKRPKVILLF
ncbi:hypothetical protein ES708_33793 [subsurface metagenome]